MLILIFFPFHKLLEYGVHKLFYCPSNDVFLSEKLLREEHHVG